MPGISASTVRAIRTTAEQSPLGPTTTRTASRNTAGAADAGRPRVPEAVKAAGRESDSGRSDGGSGGGRVPAGTNGLVICPKSVRDGIDDGVAAEFSAADALGLRFPSPDMVASAAALFEPAQPWASGRDRLGVEPESGRFRMTIGPGVVRLGWTRPVRAEKASKRAVDRHRLDVANEEDRLKAGRDIPDPPGRTITEWSRKSRTAMCRTFAELDYTPLVESGRVPAMVTLTYPGDWETVAPDGASVKRHMVLWRKRFQREWGEPARYIWKLEFQRRGAPHIHLWMAPPHGVGRSGRKFRDWLSQEWADIVGHHDAEQRARHVLAGTAIDILNGLRACNPKRLAIYFTKHSSPNSLGHKEYQHIVPRSMAAAGPRAGTILGRPRLTTSDRSLGVHSGRVPDGPQDRPSLVSLASGLWRLRVSVPHCGHSANGTRHSSTSRQSSRQGTLPQSPSTATPVQPRRTCRWLRSCQRRTSVRLPACGGFVRRLGGRGSLRRQLTFP